MRGRAFFYAGVLGLLALAPSPSQAQPVQARVETVLTAVPDVHDGATLGDRVLLATSGGLVVRRPDGSTQTLTSRDGLPGTRLRSVSVLEDGEVWVSSIEGVARLGRGRGGDLAVEATLPLRRARRVVRFAGATWIASYGNGLHRVTGDAEGTERVAFGSHPIHDHQTDLLVCNNELLVATAGAGVFRLSPEGRVRGRLREVHGLADDLVWRLVPYGDRVLVATGNGLSVIHNRRVDRGARETEAAGGIPVRDLRAALPLGEDLWVASYGGGIYRVRPGRDEPQRVGEGHRGLSLARALVATGDGVLVGHARGAHLIGAGGSVASLSSGGLLSGDVTALERAFGAVWVGTFTHGLARIRDGRVEPADRATSRWGLDRRVNHLAVTGRGTPGERLWIATDRGLYWHDGRRFVQVQDPVAPGASEHVTSLHVQPSSGDLWVASSRQLSRLSEGRWQSWTGDETLPIVNLHAVTSDRRGNIWAGSLHGLFRFDPETGSFERHSVSSGDLPVDWVTAIVPWGEGIVAGTYHGGLSWYDGRTFRIEPESAGGLPSGWVNPHALGWAGELLWIGTLERGLAFGRDGQWGQLDLADGLPSRDVTAVLPDGDGAVWVGTRGGLARVVWR